MRVSADCGEIEVRASYHSGAHLIVFESDDDNTIAALVTIDKKLVCTMQGVARVGMVKSDQEFEQIAKAKVREGSPKQWWVPQHKLAPFEKLQTEMRKGA